MVGVQLRATWTQTRKANGDIVQERVSNTINPWRGGKFMALTMRPGSVNNFALSKVWFRCGSVDLRESDISAINSSVKSWMYADLWQKPSEVVMCRPQSYGGLGVYSVKYKAQALLTRTFLETAVIPKFRHSLLHSIMFRFHVLGDTSVPNPGYLPYYPPSFHADTQHDVTTMSIKHWVQILTEDCLTMEVVESKRFKLCKAEVCSPNTDWQLSWMICRLPGLGSELTSFNFKLLHKLLVSRERLHQLTPATSPLCSLCSRENEDLMHALINCDFNNNVGNTLLNLIKLYVPSLTGPSLLRLELTNLPEEKLFSVTFFTSTILKTIWDKRMAKSRISSYEVRTTLEAK